MSHLLQRVLVGIVGIPVLLLVAVYGQWPLYIVVVVLQAGSLWEWSRLCQANGSQPNTAGMAVATAGIDCLVFAYGDSKGVGLAIVALCLVLLIDVFRRVRRPVRDLTPAVFFAIYAALPFALWTALRVPAASLRWEMAGPLAILFVTTWICDTAAYFAGSRFGKRKLDPGASPNKTVEGFVAGLVFAALVLPASAALGFCSPNVLDYLALPLIVGLAGQIGDLLESLMKRESQVKDTSALLPGHGGLLDRFDSLFLSTPLLFAYLLLTSV